MKPPYQGNFSWFPLKKAHFFTLPLPFTTSLRNSWAKQAQSQPCAQRQPQQEIERLYIELDGVLARMRRGSVPLEKEELQRKGDVYREIKAGAVFRAERGPKRSELAPGVYVDTPAPESMRYVARRTAKGGFAWLLYHLAMQCGLEQAKPGGGPG